MVTLENSEGVSFFTNVCFVCGCGLGEQTLSLEGFLVKECGSGRWETEDPAWSTESGSGTWVPRGRQHVSIGGQSNRGWEEAVWHQREAPTGESFKARFSHRVVL